MGLGSAFKEWGLDPKEEMELESPAGSESAPTRLQVVLAKLQSFEEVFDAVKHIKSGHIVILNVEQIAGEHIRRIVDVVAGAAYAKGTQIKRVSSHIFLVVPRGADYCENE